MKSFGLIGCGNMGGAILKALTAQKKFDEKDIYAADVKLTEQLKNIGITKLSTNLEAAKADILLLAVKPQILPQVASEIRDTIDYDRTVIISIAPGFTIAMLQEMLSPNAKLVRCMPNTPAMIGTGITAMCRSERITDAEAEAARSILLSAGEVEEIPEKLIDTVVGVSGSAPAYVFMFIDALADAGVRGGMTKPQALRFATQAVLGSAMLVKESGQHPAVLKDMVCSPGGTTIEAVAVLEKEGLRSAVMDCAKAAMDKSAAMGKK